MELKIKYFNKSISKVEKIEKGDWIDLRCAEPNGVHIKKGKSVKIRLGVGMILPEGYEAHVAPRSSTFKKYKVLLTNSVGVIDNCYSGNKDEWFVVFYAVEDTFIPFDERILQFRIIENQPKFDIIEVEKLNDVSRGGFGSTGSK